MSCEGHSRGLCRAQVLTARGTHCANHSDGFPCFRETLPARPGAARSLSRGGPEQERRPSQQAALRVLGLRAPVPGLHSVAVFSSCSNCPVCGQWGPRPPQTLGQRWPCPCDASFLPQASWNPWGGAFSVPCAQVLGAPGIGSGPPSAGQSSAQVLCEGARVGVASPALTSQGSAQPLDFMLVFSAVKVLVPDSAHLRRAPVVCQRVPATWPRAGAQQLCSSIII